MEKPFSRRMKLRGKGEIDMGRINLKDEPEIRRTIKRRLLQRGLILDPEGMDDWEVHGPHESMDYQVFIGLAYERQEGPDNSSYIALYLNAVYWIDNPCDWWKVRPNRRVYLQFPYASWRHLDKRR